MPSEELTTTLKLRRPRFSQAWHGGRFLAGGEIAGLKFFPHLYESEQELIIFYYCLSLHVIGASCAPYYFILYFLQRCHNLEHRIF